MFPTSPTLLNRFRTQDVSPLNASNQFVCGFTLIEMLIAIFIMAIIAIMGWRGLDGLVNARRHLSAQMEDARGIQLTFAQLQDDCANWIGSIPNFPVTIAFTDGRLSLVREITEEGRVTRFMVVSYQASDGNLIRAESIPTVDAKKLLGSFKRAVEDPIKDAVILQSGVAKIDVAFWNGRSQGSWRRVDGFGKADDAGLKFDVQIIGRMGTLTKLALLGAQ